MFKRHLAAGLLFSLLASVAGSADAAEEGATSKQKKSLNTKIKPEAVARETTPHLQMSGSLQPTVTNVNLNYESVNLPGGESMGWAGLNLMFNMTPSARLGVGTYGSLAGDRGGFITLGVVGELHKQLSKDWSVHTGLFVGGGGGHGDNSALAGGGLMLRADAGVDYQVKDLGNFGVGVSHVEFPNGHISSTQPYVRYEYPFSNLMSSGWQKGVDDDPRGWSLSSHLNEFSMVGREYLIPSSVHRSDGLRQTNHMELLGVEWLTFLDEYWYLSLETEGAGGGGSNGYMQILAGGGYRFPVTEKAFIKLKMAAGPAGGGGVDTGGGLLLDTGASLQYAVTKSWLAEVGLSDVRAPDGSFEAVSLGVKLNYQYGLPNVTDRSVSWSWLDHYNSDPLRLRMTSQTYFKGNDRWRSGNVNQAVSNIGVQADYFFGERLFLTGQALAAYEGDAGAYMVGELGLGVRWPITKRLYLEAEGLMGAAGGGGLSVGGGFVGQANASLGYYLTNDISLMASVGRVASFEGNFEANVAGVSLAYDFLGFTRK